MAEAKKTRLTHQDMVDRVSRGETVVLEDGTRVRSLADLPPAPVPTPAQSSRSPKEPAKQKEPAKSDGQPPAPVPPTPQGNHQDNPPTPPVVPPKPVSDGLDDLTKAELMAIATQEGSEPKQGTNDEIRDGIRAKRKEAAQ